FFLAFINAKLVNTNSPPRIPVLAELSPVCGSFLCCTLCFKLSLETLFTDPGFVVAIVFPLFPSFMFSDEIVLDRLSLKLSIRDALALKELDVLKLSLSLKDLLILSDSSVFIEELPLKELDTLRLSLKLLEIDVLDRKSTRLNSSHVSISYAVFCLNKKNN